jgi:hypothetical protein
MLCNMLYNTHVVHLNSFKIRQCLKAICAVCCEFCEVGIGKIILVTPLEMSSMDFQHLKCPSQTFITPCTLLVGRFHPVIGHTKALRESKGIALLYF